MAKDIAVTAAQYAQTGWSEKKYRNRVLHLRFDLNNWYGRRYLHALLEDLRINGHLPHGSPTPWNGEVTAWGSLCGEWGIEPVPPSAQHAELLAQVRRDPARRKRKRLNATAGSWIGIDNPQDGGNTEGK